MAKQREPQEIDLNEPYQVEFDPDLLDTWGDKLKELVADGFFQAPGTSEDRKIAEAGICPICLKHTSFVGLKRKSRPRDEYRCFAVCIPCNSAEEF